MASFVVTLVLLCVFCSSLVSGRRYTVRYSVIIDAGSTGTRVHVFRYKILGTGKTVLDFGEENYTHLKLSPGLSSYADNPKGASVSVGELVKYAKGIVPKGLWKKTEIRLMATAGMRLLDLSVQEEILHVARRVLRRSGFKFRNKWASVIPGSDEGVYAWVVANHARGSLGGDPLHTTGIIELGGASAQVIFVPSELVPPEYARTISYGNVSYTLYSHSFLNFGRDAALENLWASLKNSAVNGIATDPCTPKGYIFDTNSLQAAGNYSKCRSATFAMLQEGKEKCSSKHCAIGSTFTPDLQGRFLATGNFFHTSTFFELKEKDWLSKMIPAGKSFCGEEWSELKKKYPTTEDEYLSRYCFSSAYIISMLHDSFGVPLDGERIIFADKAGEGIPLDWALGAFILNTATTTSDHSGSDEGVYAWVVANHARGSLGGDPLQTTGIIELGGASAQVIFVPSELVPPEYARTISYGNVSYTLYSHSFLNFGRDAALENLWASLKNSAVNGIATDPCTPKGYIFDTNSLQAAGNYSKCRSATFAMLQEGKEKCSSKHCAIGSTFTPDLQGRFLATGNFFHTSTFFELKEKDWLSKMIPAGKSFCGEEWSELKKKYPTTEDEYLSRYCFSSAYIISMLHDSFGVPLDGERIIFADKAGEGIPLDWALGAFILNTATTTSDHSGKSRKMFGLIT